MRERWKLVSLAALIAAAAFVPFGHPRVRAAGLEAFLLLREYAREHILFCLVPAFFIAGAITVFLSQGAVLRYLGAGAKRVVAYGVAAVSGSVLAVCSCTVLPLFAGIYQRGAGLGPATAFLYSGPAVNVLAIVLTAQVLGWKLGLARAVGAVGFSVVVGLSMGALFRREEAQRMAGADAFDAGAESGPPLRRAAAFLVALVGLLVFAAWGKPQQPVGFADAIHAVHFPVAGLFLSVVLWMTWRWFRAEEREEWLLESWGYAKLILPPLFVGVLVAGFLLGRPGSDAGIVPAHWVADLVGGESLQANFIAALSGALMYFATLTEVPILEGLLGQGMGEGPALSLLLAGPAVSLPNLLVIRSVLGTRKTLAYAGLVVVFSTLAGTLYGFL